MKSDIVRVRVTPKLKERLRERAEQMALKPSQLTRMLLAQGLAERPVEMKASAEAAHDQVQS